MSHLGQYEHKLFEIAIDVGGRDIVIYKQTLSAVVLKKETLHVTEII